MIDQIKKTDESGRDGPRCEQRLVLHDWQPIESAPRDGTYILIYLASVKNVIHAHYKGVALVDCWCKVIDPSVYLPTHWMPLSLPNTEPSR